MPASLTEIPAAPEGTYEIYQMTYARDHHRRVHNNFIFADMHDGPMPVDFNIWILRNEKRIIVVDTGFGERTAVQRGRPLDFDPVDGLEQIGIPAASVEDVVITHMHFDHAGSIHRFDKARFHVQDREVGFATGRCMCEAFTRRPFDVEDVVTLIRRNYEGRVVFHDGDAAPFPGITLHRFPGHTPGLQALRVQTARGPVILASDVSHYWANILALKPFNLTVSTVETLDSYRQVIAIAGTPDRIIPGHDPKVRRLFPAVTINGIELFALHEAPGPYEIADLIRTDNF